MEGGWGEEGLGTARLHQTYLQQEGGISGQTIGWPTSQSTGSLREMEWGEADWDP